MKVVFYFAILEVFLLMTHIYASTRENKDESGTTTISFPTSRSTDNLILKKTETPPVVTTDPCSSPEPPVINTYTNTSLTTDFPAISWELIVNPNSCNEDSILYITCINNTNETVETVINVTGKAKVSHQLNLLKDQVTYRCSGRLKAGTTESNSSQSIIISTMKTELEKYKWKSKTEIKRIKMRRDVAKKQILKRRMRKKKEELEKGNGKSKRRPNRRNQEMPKQNLIPPEVHRYINSSITTIDPKIYWKIILDDKKDRETFTLYVNCTNIENEIDVTFNQKITNERVVSTLDSLKEPAIYGCYGILKNKYGKSKSSDPIFVSTIIRDKINITKMNFTATGIFIEWKAPPPSKTKLNYLVHITEKKAGHFSPDCKKPKNTTISNITKQTYYYFEDASPDYSYSIVISTIIRNNRISSDVKTITTLAAAPEKPRNVVIQNSRTDDLSANISIILSWDMPCKPNGRIQRFDIELTGVYTPDHSHNPKKNFTYTLEMPNQENFSKTLEGLTASTNYTLNIKAVGDNVDEGLGYEMSFITRDAVPSDPEVNIASQSSSYLEIRWKLPDSVRFGKITSYNLNIIPVKPVSGQYPSTCVAQEPYYRQFNDSITNFNYTPAHGDWIYDIYVNASTSLGTGPNGTLNATTNTSAPEKPRNVDVQNSTSDDGSTNISKILSWDMPCNPNGRIQRFDIELTGVYTPDHSQNHVKNFTYTLETQYQEKFSELLEGLTASTNYTLNIKAVGENRDVGLGYETSFRTRDAKPVAPKVYITSQSSSYLYIRWKLPEDILYGKITTYKLSILPLNPAYGQYPRKCQAQEPFYRRLNGSTSSFNYTHAHGYWIYDIHVTASTSQGTGPNGTLQATTNTSAPEEPRNVIVRNSPRDDDSSKISKILRWDMPCMPNGRIQRFDLKLTGVYRPDHSHTTSMKFNYNLTNYQEHFVWALEGLTASTNYTLNIRAVGTNGDAGLEYETSFSTRDARTRNGVILGLIIGLLIAGILAMITYIVWKKGLFHFRIIMNRFPRSIHTKPKDPTRIPCRKFLQYCRNMECNPQKYHEEFTLLTERAKEIRAEQTVSIANLPENRRKNRYPNICPYDETRVELRIDEDDEIGSDYINASFIKGYSGNVEYIATQGPMVTTTRDFWKMVLQENVTLIAMVAQFVENDIQKCHRYFPKNHETMIICDIEVRCLTEIHLGTYCVRNLQIKKNDLQATVTHMQFLDWPDFGVPNGTDQLSQFCHQLRERIMLEGGLIIVHCSAGVGRTGTLIATDILLQAANAETDIDVYNTVLELRKQRAIMVQKDKQYIFIHSMLKDHLDRPQSPDLVENSEQVFENMEILPDLGECKNYRNRIEYESKC